MAGNPQWQKGVSGNYAGRPKTVNKDRKNNKEQRADELLKLLRKLYPHLSKSVKAISDVLDDKDAPYSEKLKASALYLKTYSEVIKDLYDKSYDLDEATPAQEENKPLFSLTMINSENKETEE